MFRVYGKNQDGLAFVASRLYFFVAVKCQFSMGQGADALFFEHLLEFILEWVMSWAILDCDPS